MHNVVLEVLLQMLRIGRVVLCTCVAPLLLCTVYTRVSKMSTQNVRYVKITSSAYAAVESASNAASPHLTAFSSSTVTKACMLVTLLLRALAPTPSLMLLHHVLTSHARWAYLDLVACREPFLYGLHPHVLVLVLCLLGSCHTTSL